MVEKGIKKKDGSGKGIRDNFNRGGCFDNPIDDLFKAIEKAWNDLFKK